MISTFTTVFPFVYTLTRGGPGYATYLLDYYVYDAAFFGGSFGYASAIGMVLLRDRQRRLRPGVLAAAPREGPHDAKPSAGDRQAEALVAVVAACSACSRSLSLYPFVFVTFTAFKIQAGLRRRSGRPALGADARIPRAGADHRQHARLPAQFADRRRRRGACSCSSSPAWPAMRSRSSSSAARALILLGIICLLAVPAAVVMIPLYRTVSQLGLMNSHLGPDAHLYRAATAVLDLSHDQLLQRPAARDHRGGADGRRRTDPRVPHHRACRLRRRRFRPWRRSTSSGSSTSCCSAS